MRQPKVSALDERKGKIQATANQLKEKQRKVQHGPVQMWEVILKNDRPRAEITPTWIDPGRMVQDQSTYIRKIMKYGTSGVKSVGDMAMMIVKAMTSPTEKELSTQS